MRVVRTPVGLFVALALVALGGLLWWQDQLTFGMIAACLGLLVFMFSLASHLEWGVLGRHGFDDEPVE